jgi:hypothetical protein
VCPLLNRILTYLFFTSHTDFSPPDFPQPRLKKIRRTAEYSPSEIITSLSEIHRRNIHHSTNRHRSNQQTASRNHPILINSDSPPLNRCHTLVEREVGMNKRGIKSLEMTPLPPSSMMYIECCLDYSFFLLVPFCFDFAEKIIPPAYASVWLVSMRRRMSHIPLKEFIS